MADKRELLGVSYFHVVFTLPHELNELCRLTPSMSEEEIALRRRATDFPGYPGASIDQPPRQGVPESGIKDG